MTNKVLPIKRTSKGEGDELSKILPWSGEEAKLVSRWEATRKEETERASRCSG